MIRKITIENFRCFNQTEISFKNLTVLVGKNNAGKSTLVEALRILSLVVNRASNLQYNSPPEWLDLDGDTMGIYPSIANLDISTRNIFHLYGDPPAIVKAYFDNGARCEIYIGPEAEVFAVLFNSAGVNVASKGFANQLQLRPINILPQIGPLLRSENIVKFKTVQKNLDTNLNSRNFRNQLIYFHSDFASFKDLAEKTWRGLSISDPHHSNNDEGTLALFIRDNAFEAEIGWMGHGLQMWLQTIWFLARCEKDSTIILDEPDVYMHADLQRRLMRLISNKYKQIMIATHSIEMISEVEADNILPIDNSKNMITYANKAPIVQQIIDNLGSVHNIEIARIFAHKKFLIVEGDKDDVKILGILQSKIFPNTFEPFDILPKVFTEGWGGWQRVIGSFKVFKDNKTELKIYCILDSDYHTELQKKDRMDEAEQLGFNLHIWSRKEIESFLLVPTCILRLIEKNKRTSTSITLSKIESKLQDICADLRNDVVDSFATEIKSSDNSLALKTVNQMARKLVDEIWFIDYTTRVPAKEVIARLSEWTNQEFKFNISPFKLAREMNLSEINDEVVRIVSSIEHMIDFANC